MEANAIGSAIEFRNELESGTRRLLLLFTCSSFLYFLPTSPSQPYDSQVHMVKKMTSTAKR